MILMWLGHEARPQRSVSAHVAFGYIPGQANFESRLNFRNFGQFPMLPKKIIYIYTTTTEARQDRVFGFFVCFHPQQARPACCCYRPGTPPWKVAFFWRFFF